jgi:hypothetical protein
MERLSRVSERHVDPTVRLACGGILCIASALVDVSTPRGIGAEVVLIATALALRRHGIRSLVGLVAAGIVFFAPVAFLGAPTTALKGAAAMLAIMAPMAGLPAHEWSVALLRIPLPRHVRLLLEQILHQSEVLGLETRNVYRALTVRGARRGIGGLMMFSHALPSVWLPRVALRAERVAIAMDLRGYMEHTPGSVSLNIGARQWLLLAIIVAVGVIAVLFSYPGAH